MKRTVACLCLLVSSVAVYSDPIVIGKWSVSPQFHVSLVNGRDISVSTKNLDGEGVVMTYLKDGTGDARLGKDSVSFAWDMDETDGAFVITTSEGTTQRLFFSRIDTDTLLMLVIDTEWETLDATVLKWVRKN